MSRYSVHLEIADDGRCMAHVLDLPGCIVRAPTRDEALSRLLNAIRDYHACLHRHGEPAPTEEEPIEIEIAGESTGFGPFDPGDAAALFPQDREPITPEEMEHHFRLMAHARADLLALVRDLPDDLLDWQPDPQCFSIRRLLRHVGNAEEWYVSRLVPPETLPSEWEHDEDLPLFQFLEMERRTAVARLRRLTDEERSSVFYPVHWTEHPEEPWTARKALRRFLEHEREHTAQVREIFAAIGHQDSSARRCFITWLEKLNGDPLPWLLEPENPSVRYWTLLDILERPADDPEVCAARAAINTFSPVAELLAAQKRDGYWVKRDYYLPKNYGTFWVLSVLADLGLTVENEHAQRGCEFLFAHQREHGGFCRRRRVRGRGIVWEAQPDPCTHARIVRFLIQFGYGDDPRTRAAVNWLLANQRDDAMWLCNRAGRHGCLRATLDYLRAAVLDPETAAHPATARAAAVVCDLLMEPRMGRYHVGDLWTILEYPYFGYGVISALDTLARLGYTVEQPKMALAMEYLLSRQLANGTWPLNQVAPRPPFDVGQPSESNKWLTLDALRVIKLLHGQN